jgi:predicted transcriptional regulator
MPTSTGRPDLFVVVRLLEVIASHPEGIRKTPLQLAAGVNYTVVARYLDQLVRRGLVELRSDPEGNERVFLTRRGVEALQFLVRGIGEVVGYRNPGTV